MKPSDYDGMVTSSADGFHQFRIYEPRRWQLGRKLRWLWWRVLSRFTTRIVLGRLTLALDDRTLDVRCVAVPAPARTPRRTLDQAAERFGTRRH